MEGSLHYLEDDAMMGTIVFDRKDRIRELQKYMSPKYVGVAFNLPLACGTFWGLMEEEIGRFAGEDPHPFSKDVNEVLKFLGIFFSTNLVERVRVNMLTLGNSFLGIDYTLRPGKGMIARVVLDDVKLECDIEGSPLHDFLGHVDLHCDGEGDGDVADDSPRDGDTGDDGGWQRQGRRRHRRSVGDSSSGGSNVGRGGGGSHRGGRGLGRGAGRGAGRGGGGNRVDPIHFQSMDRETISVPMSPFSTPPYGDPEMKQSLKSRSWEFISHGLVGDHRAEMYDPHISESGKVYLFHGTRTSSLIHFQRRGIDPRYRHNEFSMDAAFYVSNSIRQAYEHPLHYHPSSILNGTVSILVFELDVLVLHGLQPPPGESSPLTNLWFRDTDEDKRAWQIFCKDNFQERGTMHRYDIVIGPVCIPTDNNRDYEKMSVSLPGNAPLTQIAFCSSRARAWLEQCFKKVYVERRGASQASPASLSSSRERS